jgi:hypothetical protein
MSRSLDEGHESVTVRRISNGYVTSHSRSGPAGYDSSETFSRSKPCIDKVRDGPERDTTGFTKATMHQEINQAINGKFFE